VSRIIKVPSKKNITEQKALKLIISKGKEGLLQSDLWRELNISSREASRIAKKFEENGNIERHRVMSNSRWTYKLFSKKEQVTLDSVRGCPCLICPELIKCFRGGTLDPVYCVKLTAWIDPRIKTK
jgi:DNA-binding Lrp family transcriptional regulator